MTATFPALVDRAKMATATAGTGTITLGSASTGYFTFAEAGVTNGQIVDYVIEDGNDFEIGQGVYTAAGTTLSRVRVLRSKIGGTAGTTKITLSGNATVFVSLSTDNFPTTGFLQNYLSGLTLSNDAGDAVNDVGIAVGACADSTNVVWMRLASALIKRLDASWAVGTNQGGLDGSESVGGTPDISTWYHVWLIMRSDTGVVDVLFSESATAPTMPASYDYKRRIGAVRNNASGDILAFTQVGDRFRWTVPIRDLNTNNPGTSAVTVTLTVPTGLKVVAQFMGLPATSSAAYFGLFSDLATTDVAPSSSDTPGIHFGVNTSQTGRAELSIMTNTSGQIRYRQGVASDTTTDIRVVTLGWDDRRGRDG